jgi:hypothetical protein
MKTEISIVVPTSFSAVKMKDYLPFQKDLDNYWEDGEEAVIAVTLHHLCKIDPKWIRQIPTSTYTQIKESVNKLLNKEDYNLKRIIHIDGREYGFEPELNTMDYGLYGDISAYKDFEMNEKWAEIMSLLYRPITNRLGNQYQIEDYKGIINAEPFMDITMDVHFGALFFFKRLQRDLLKTTLNYLMEREEMPHNIKSILAKSGELTQV